MVAFVVALFAATAAPFAPDILLVKVEGSVSRVSGGLTTTLTAGNKVTPLLVGDVLTCGKGGSFEYQVVLPNTPRSVVSHDACAKGFVIPFPPLPAEALLPSFMKAAGRRRGDQPWLLWPTTGAKITAASFAVVRWRPRPEPLTVRIVGRYSGAVVATVAVANGRTGTVNMAAAPAAAQAFVGRGESEFIIELTVGSTVVDRSTIVLLTAAEEREIDRAIARATDGFGTPIAELRRAEVLIAYALLPDALDTYVGLASRIESAYLLERARDLAEELGDPRLADLTARLRRASGR